MILSVTRATGSISTNIEVSITFLSELLGMNWRDRETYGRTASFRHTALDRKDI